MHKWLYTRPVFAYNIRCRVGVRLRMWRVIFSYRLYGRGGYHKYRTTARYLPVNGVSASTCTFNLNLIFAIKKKTNRWLINYPPTIQCDFVPRAHSALCVRHSAGNIILCVVVVIIRYQITRYYSNYYISRIILAILYTYICRMALLSGE